MKAAAADTGGLSPSGVLLAQIRKNLTLMATTSQLPKLLVYSAVSSPGPQGAQGTRKLGSSSLRYLGLAGGAVLMGSPLPYSTTPRWWLCRWRWASTTVSRPPMRPATCLSCTRRTVGEWSAQSALGRGAQVEGGAVGSLRGRCWPGEPLPACLPPTRRNFSVEMYFRNESHRDPWPLTLPGCPNRCPLQDFLRLTEPVVPKDWLQECKLAGGPADTGERPSASVLAEAQNGSRFLPRGLQRLRHLQSWCRFPDSPLPSLRCTPCPQATPFLQQEESLAAGRERTVSPAPYHVSWPSRWREPSMGARLSTCIPGSFPFPSTWAPVLSVAALPDQSRRRAQQTPLARLLLRLPLPFFPFPMGSFRVA